MGAQGRSRAGYAVSLSAAAAVWFSVGQGGNPTQQVDRLFRMMARGVTGGESADVFGGQFEGVEGNEHHNKSDASIARSFYNLATEFYEYGWGDSFHFGFRQAHEPHSMCIRNSQAFVAQRLQVGNMDRVLDMGCGIGGPLRGVVRVTGANVTGVTINEFQVRRAREITSRLTPYMQERCHYVVQDYLNMRDFEPASYDAAFYMESSLHCENRTQTFAEAFRLLKPGGRLVAMEYALLDGWDPVDPELSALMTLHMRGNGAARTPTVAENVAMVEAAGFAVPEHYDFMGVGDAMYGADVWPWWQDLQLNFRFHLLPAHPWVRGVLPYFLRAFAFVGLVPPEVPAAAALMNEGGDGLSGLGKAGAITPQYYILGVKP